MTKINQIENEKQPTFNQPTNNPFKFTVNSSQPKKKIDAPPLKTLQKIYRQGDILFKQVKALPSTRSKKVENVIAEGELAGHTHLLNDGALYEVINSESLYIKANENTRITHDEHLPIRLESGNYKVVRQREYLGKGLNHRIVAD